MNEFFMEIIRGVIISVLYLWTTKANDTNIENVLTFVSFYVIMINAAAMSGISTTTVTNAFITKTIFTLIDERIKSKDKDSKKID
jgi:hypothetical protein